MEIEPHELMEQMEHASHADHVAAGAHGGKPAGVGTGKLIGLTMAVLGVLLAFSSAMVGASRTEFIAAMVQKSTAALEFQSLSTKYRMIEGHVQAMHAALPTNLEEFMAQDKQIADSAAAITGDGAAQAKLLVLVRDQIMNTVMPTQADAIRLVDLTKQFDTQQGAAKEWVESYQDLIQVHYEASERFERGQLVSEVGIVLASIALLLMNKKVWLGAVILACCTIGLNAYAFVSTHEPAHKAEDKIEEAKKKFEETIDEKKEKESDDKLLDDIMHAYPPAGAEAPKGAAKPEDKKPGDDKKPEPKKLEDNKAGDAPKPTSTTAPPAKKDPGY